MKFGVATISLPSLNIGEAVAEIAAAGFGGIEWRVEPRPGSIRDATPAHPFLVNHRSTIPLDVAAAAEVARETRAAGLEIVGLAPYIEVGDTGTLRLACEMAAAAGAPQIRVQAPRISRTHNPYSVLYEETVAFFGEIEAAARATGIRVLLEIHHNTICSSAALAHRVVARFAPSHVGVIYDLGNLVFEGYEAHEIALDLLGDHLGHVHLKNAAHFRSPGGGWRPDWTPLEDGEVDVPHVLELLDQRGYRDWVSVEDMSLDREPRAALHHNAAQLREWGLLR
ncbi:sugar phosphate isomerase/epimerase [Amycolatopsis sp. K13G38]|uniref:Sugar phosphate isomerase/epimerase n=1 Tax=Amycolatopsis acididurans TaxID=2724524 RepID=A0ABX1JDP2_9PSEU|nr:sugar phosphate isomerase/epimerase [Amycolatopsis acididurans]NKQ57913.1 sugar phosphate isomerase/epimerase [Amycolatopsis acididurans]